MGDRDSSGERNKGIEIERSRERGKEGRETVSSRE